MPTQHSVLWSFSPLRLVSARRAAVLLATAASLGLTACGDDDDDGPTGSSGITGTYTIVSATGLAGTDNSAPFVLIDQVVLGSDVLVELLSGSRTLSSNGRYTGTQEFRFTFGGEIDPDLSGPDPDAGSYTVSGNTVTFVEDDDPNDPDDNNAADRTTTATFTGGNTLTVAEPVDLDGDGNPDTSFTIVASK